MSVAPAWFDQDAHAMQESATTTAVIACVSCGAAAPSRYCPECGQRQHRRRHTLRSLTGDTLGKVFNLESGLAYTIYNLSRRPDAVISGYVSGATSRYTHPALYLLIAFTVFAVSARIFGGFRGGGAVERIVAILFVPSVAAAARLVFARARFNYAEHLILAMYVMGHVALLLAAVQLPIPLLSRRAAQVLVGGALCGAVVYNSWVYARVFRSRAILAALGGFAAWLGGAAVWGVLLAGLIQLVRR